MPPQIALEIVLATDDGGALPREGGALVVWGIVAAIILGLYFVLRATRRRSVDDYWRRSRREEQLRDDDPDMRHD